MKQVVALCYIPLSYDWCKRMYTKFISALILLQHWDMFIIINIPKRIYRLALLAAAQAIVKAACDAACSGLHPQSA